MCELIKVFLENRNSNSIAIIDSEGRNISYGVLINSSIYWANYLNSINASDNIILFAGNCIEFVIGLYSIWISKRTVVLADITKNAEDIEIMSKRYNCNVVIQSCLTENINIEGSMSVVCDIREQQNSVEVCKRSFPKDAIIFQTSGTTHFSKSVPLSFVAVLAECKALKNAYLFDCNTIDTIIFPITSVSGCLGQLVPIMYSSGTVLIYQGKINIKKIARIVSNSKATRLVCTPSIFSLIVKSTTVSVEAFKSINVFVLGGEPCDTMLCEIAKKKFPNAQITQAYGLTETSSALACSVNTNAPYESVGKILENFVVQIVKDGIVLERDSIGEIEVKGASVTDGYYDDDELTKASFDDGWFKTGDMGYIDNRNYLYVKGRIKNIIIVSGKNVCAEEVEQILLRSEMVKKIHVYGCKSALTGEKIVADIVPEQEGNFDRKGLLAFCKQNLEAYMIPDIINIVPDIEIALSGKQVRKRNV